VKQSDGATVATEARVIRVSGRSDMPHHHHQH
jgi:hypothetical protein